ncbi:hypothetical protein PVAND_000851 [Polypedilum vanderplanki]|uniref:Attractin GBD domain-containing protein n=1 Tax=Polypedilum vanderplanki TaxID=319348 RepID=A0A9J6BL49_POLVA|nr:hypothetical protein PVAND_000851 [Polypedilum vanderplanki]
MKTELSVFVLVVVLFLAIDTADFADSPKSCEPGFWGTPCKKCECGDKASACDFNTGKCYCNTKGLIGEKCDQCDEKKRYKGDAIKDTCYHMFDEGINYNFRLTGPANTNITKINFKFAPENKEENIHLKVSCIDHCNEFTLKLTGKEVGRPTKLIVDNKKMKDKEVYEKILLSKDFKFGIENDKPMTEFFIYLTNFKTPIIFEINAVIESKSKEKIAMTMSES